VAAAAATVAILLIVGDMLFRNPAATVTSMADDFVQTVLNDSITGKDIRLVVAAGKHIDIKGDRTELSYNDKGQVAINSESLHPPGADQVQMNCLIVPYGKTSTITLCDGSKIQVNSGSKLVFPPVFEEHQREIYVDGEIFVEVTKDESKPFIVKTKHVDVRVTGTSFDVSSYGDEETNSVVLVSGSVNVTDKTSNQEFRMQPNQIFSFHTETHETGIATTDIYNHICWIYGFLHFNDESLEDVLQKIGRHYGIWMIYNQEQLSDIRVSGKLDLKENIGDVMQNIVTTAHIRYEIVNHQSRIMHL
jgi:hypothetical protein